MSLRHVCPMCDTAFADDKLHDAIVRAERAEAERDALRRDVRQYLKAFVHYHVNNGTDDACKQCGLDLRNPVHSFVDVAEVIAPALREKP